MDRNQYQTMRRALAVLIAAASMLVGCGAGSDYMRPGAAPKLEAEAETARVVFLRPSGFASAIKTTILDGHGQFLGDSLPTSYFVVDLPAGEHVFVAWAENTSALRAKLAPGKVYYVEVSPKMGAWSARVGLLALSPRSEECAELQGWLADSRSE